MARKSVLLCGHMDRKVWGTLTPRQKIEAALSAAKCSLSDLAAYLHHKPSYVKDVQTNKRKITKSDDVLLYRLVTGNVSNPVRYGTFDLIPSAFWDKRVVDEELNLKLTHLKTLYVANSIASRLNTLFLADKRVGNSAGVYVSLGCIYGGANAYCDVEVRSWRVDELAVLLEVGIEEDGPVLNYMAQRFNFDQYKVKFKTKCTEAAIRKFTAKAKTFIVAELKRRRII